MPSWLVVTGRIRQEMRVRLPCVGAYLGLSWGTNSKASLCSSCFEGTANHLSALCITDNKGCKYWTRSTNLKTLHLGNQQEKEAEEAFCVLRSVLHFHQSCCIKGPWLSDSSQNQTLYKSLFPDNNDVDNSVTEVKPHTNLNFYVAFLCTCISKESCTTSALTHCSWLALEFI